MGDQLAVSEYRALKMLYLAGFDTEAKLKQASNIIKSLKPVSDGYYLANDVSKAIELNRDL